MDCCGGRRLHQAAAAAGATGEKDARHGIIAVRRHARFITLLMLPFFLCLSSVSHTQKEERRVERRKGVSRRLFNSSIIL